MSEDAGIEVWRGGVNMWELDDNAHMNVRFYVQRVMEGLAGLAAALGLPDAFRPMAETTLIIREKHIRFLREARSRAPLHMTAGVLEMGPSDARLLFLIHHSMTGELAASFQVVVGHVTALDHEPRHWPHYAREAAEGLKIEVPERAAPRSVKLEPIESIAGLDAAKRLGLVHLSGGAFLAHDCDVFGRMRAEQFIARVSDGIPRLSASFRATVAENAEAPPTRVGGAVLEYRIIFLAWPRIGDLFEVRSGIAGFDERAQRMVHWMVDPVSGGAWATSEAYAVSLDLDTRKMIPITGEARERMLERVTPGLAL